jgi:hypothetical protein
VAVTFSIKPIGIAAFFVTMLFRHVESNSSPGACDIRVLAPPPDDARVFRYEHRCPEGNTTHRLDLPALSDDSANCPAEYILGALPADGCSGGGRRDRWRFQAACNEHDKCYATEGMTKAECDANFSRNMDMICNVVGGAFCQDARRGFVSGVVIAGDAPYRNAQQWAEKRCT